MNENDPGVSTPVEGQNGIVYENTRIPDPIKGGETEQVEQADAAYVQGQQGE